MTKKRRIRIFIVTSIIVFLAVFFIWLYTPSLPFSNPGRITVVSIEKRIDSELTDITQLIDITQIKTIAATLTCEKMPKSITQEEIDNVRYVVNLEYEQESWSVNIGDVSKVQRSGDKDAYIIKNIQVLEFTLDGMSNK